MKLGSRSKNVPESGSPLGESKALGIAGTGGTPISPAFVFESPLGLSVGNLEFAFVEFFTEFELVFDEMEMPEL